MYIKLIVNFFFLVLVKVCYYNLNGLTSSLVFGRVKCKTFLSIAIPGLVSKYQIIFLFCHQTSFYFHRC